MRNTQYIRVGDILCPVRLYAGRASYIPFQYRKTGSKHDGSELSEDKQYHCSYHVYEPFVYRHYRRTQAATIEIGSAYLRIVGFSQLFATLEILTSGAYTGQGLTKYPATVSIVFTTMRIPLALLLGKSMGMGIDGVWWSISLTSVIKGIVLYLLYRKREKELEESNIQYSSI